MPYELKAGESRKTCLTNRTRPISHHITPLVINGLGGGHTDTRTYTQTHTRILTRGPKQFQETRRARPLVKKESTKFTKTLHHLEFLQECRKERRVPKGLQLRLKLNVVDQTKKGYTHSS